MSHIAWTSYELRIRRTGMRYIPVPLGEPSMLEGTITFVSPKNIDNPLDAQRQLESLLRGNRLPTFGGEIVLLRGITFDWSPNKQDQELFNDWNVEAEERGAAKLKVGCIVVLTYQSNVVALRKSEVETRVKSDARKVEAQNQNDSRTPTISSE